MTTELATIDGEVIEQRAPMTLFGTDDPSAVVERASTVASALAEVIGERNLTTRIGNKDHVQVEGWTLLGSMLGVFAEVEWTHPIENGWEARAVARTLNGNVVGAAEAMCTRKERTWGNRDDYALRSMAQTRAVSKALRMPLGFIMHLAGYSATPAEELVEDAPAPVARRAAQRTPAEQALLDQILAVPGMTTARMSLMADAVGVEKGERATEEQLRLMVGLIETPDGGASADGEEGAEVARASAPPTDSDSEGEVGPPGTPSESVTMDDILAVTGGEEVPPKPGSPEYKALPSGTERAAAKAYWEVKPDAVPA
jgi:hypothetical protein